MSASCCCWAAIKGTGRSEAAPAPRPDNQPEETPARMINKYYITDSLSSGAGSKGRQASQPHTGRVFRPLGSPALGGDRAQGLSASAPGLTRGSEPPPPPPFLGRKQKAPAGLLRPPWGNRRSGSPLGGSQPIRRAGNGRYGERPSRQAPPPSSSERVACRRRRRRCPNQAGLSELLVLLLF